MRYNARLIVTSAITVTLVEILPVAAQPSPHYQHFTCKGTLENLKTGAVRPAIEFLYVDLDRGYNCVVPRAQIAAGQPCLRHEPMAEINGNEFIIKRDRIRTFRFDKSSKEYERLINTDDGSELMMHSRFTCRETSQ